METVETYIVRIYRRDRNDPEKIAGLVETVGSGEKRLFDSLEALWGVLGPEPAGKPVGRTKERKERSSILFRKRRQP